MTYELELKHELPRMDDLDTTPAEQTPKARPKEAAARPDALDMGRTVIGLQKEQTVFGRYTLLKPVGRGGMGIVWLARDVELEREVALKFLPEALMDDEKGIRGLKSETRKALELTHHHIVRIHNFESDERMAAICMEFVDGASLEKLLARKAEQVFEVRELEPLVAQICEALSYAHEKARTVHRDLKPANLMLNAKGELKVTDFGISARLRRTQVALSSVAVTGISGTPLYMSPQQMSGDDPSPSDDIYSLGATLYELLTGEPPFYEGEIVMQVMKKIPPSLAERRAKLGVGKEPIPQAWEDTIAACLAKNPLKRPGSAKDVAQRLLSGITPEISSETIADSPDQTRFDMTRDKGPRPTVPDGKSPKRTTPPLGKVTAKPERTEVRPKPVNVQPKAQPRASSSRIKWVGVAACLAVAAVGAWIFQSQKSEISENREGGKAAAIGKTGMTTESAVTKPLTAKSATEPAKETFPSEPVRQVSAPVENKALPAKAQETPPSPVSPPREFILTIDPAEVAAQVWLGPIAALDVKNGRAVLKDLPEGEHELAIAAPGYQTYMTRVSVKNGLGSVEAKLVPLRGTLVLKARPGTSVTAINEQGREIQLGVVPSSGILENKDLLQIGTYKLRLLHPDCRTSSIEKLNLRAGRPEPANAVQTPYPAELRIFTDPGNAEITIDGQSAGQTPATIKTLESEKEHRVVVRLQGYVSTQASVTLKPKEIRSLNFGILVAEKEHSLPRSPSLQETNNKVENASTVQSGLVEEFSSTAVKGRAYGVQTVDTPTGRGAEFSRSNESRIEYPFENGFPAQGTLEWRIFVKSGFGYSDGKLSEPTNDALIFTTAGPDTWYPGCAWVTVCRNGEVNFRMADSYGGQTPVRVLAASNTSFRFGEWHTIGISYGSEGRLLNVDGHVVAKDSFTQAMGVGGTLQARLDKPTLGKMVSNCWTKNRYDSGFNGIVDTFRMSPRQADWQICK